MASTGIIMAIAITLGTTLILALVGLPFLLGALRGRQLLTSGLPRQAEIEYMGDTGVTVNGQPMVSFGLIVHQPEGAAYRVTHRQTLPRIPMGLIVPGAVVPVRVDPQRGDRVHIDWAAWRPAYPGA
ncbi:hypothetical protein [Nonomuraea soli]|uniref:DUF3592 domain-containing protein n=1 Tax=Nonomuraea soli TaxID=1032476 RepID=A0A7W0HRB0_9ACTN|nr:hypothetical protein [Nonomuraea soli]MBA2892765.1 hypothetical protein [Nonomuraea soli]